MTTFENLLSDAVAQKGIISKAYSVFHNYSLGNQLAAWQQLSWAGKELSPIATYKKWQSLGRQVKKGEKALALCQPVTFPDKENKEKIITIFKWTNQWFSLDQTEGADYSQEIKIPTWDKEKALENLGIEQVKFSLSNGNCQGYASGNSIAINPIAQYPHKTLFHELAHVVLGHTTEHLVQDDEKTERNIMEVEAEVVSYILCSLLKLSGLEESRGYIQSWLRSEKIPEKSAQKIFNAANKILLAGSI